jgi:ribonuclease-3
MTLISSGGSDGAEREMLGFRGPLGELERRLGYRFRRREWLERALTHRSFANEQGLAHDYERLEFLGDAVLGLVTAEWLFAEHPEVAEGKLSEGKSRLVSETALAFWARKIGLGKHLRLGVGEERSGGRDKRSLLADSMEAVLGAVFIDGGLKKARKAILPLLNELAAQIREEELRDPKTRLQELAQAGGWGLPVYHLVAEEGPDHEKIFVVECGVDGVAAGKGRGRSKKRAEQAAASEVLEALEVG